MSENNQLYRDLVENSRDLICTHDLDGVLLTVNLAAARTLGYEPVELVNRSLRELLSPKVYEDLDAYLTALREKKLASGFIELWSKSGEKRIWEYTSTLRIEGVQVPFVRAMAHDVTEILQAQKALRESEERLRLAAEVGRMYAWEWDPATDSVLRSAECAGILGLDDSPREGVAKDYFDLIHPDDRARLWRLANSLTPKDPEYRTEYRRFRPDGALLWLEESCHATFDKAGTMIRLVGMTANITERKQGEEKLRASEERSRQIAQKSPVAMVVSRGPEQKVELVNDKFITLFGYTKNDMPSVAEWWSLAYPDDAYREAVTTEWQARVGEAIKNRSEIAPMEAKVRCKDGSFRYIEFHFASLGETNLVSFVDLTDRKNVAEALANVRGRLIEAQENERTRIARELHDDICQRLALLALVLDQMQHGRPDWPPEVRSRMGELWKQTSEIVTDLQSLSHDLHSAKLEFMGLAAAMKGFCKEFAKEQKVQIDFQTHDLPRPLPSEISLCLFRVLQEALHNSTKHSGARHFEVRLWVASGEIHLTVADFGKGFDTEAAKESQGLGLISMQERLRILNGTFSIESKPERGTTIHARVPMSNVAQASALGT